MCLNMLYSCLNDNYFLGLTICETFETQGRLQKFSVFNIRKTLGSESATERAAFTRSVTRCFRVLYLHVPMSNIFIWMKLLAGFVATTTSFRRTECVDSPARAEFVRERTSQTSRVSVHLRSPCRSSSFGRPIPFRSRQNLENARYRQTERMRT